MMSGFLKPIAAAFVGLLLLGACAETPSGSDVRAPEGATAYQALESFTRTAGIAETIGMLCRSSGIRTTYRSRNDLVSGYVKNLAAQGYSLAELKRAVDRLDPQASGKVAVKYLTDRGARVNDPASLCAVGVQEIKNQTAVGKLLKLG